MYLDQGPPEGFSTKKSCATGPRFFVVQRQQTGEVIESHHDKQTNIN